MLLFIKTPYQSSGKTYTRFNTSHVVIYLISVKLSVPFFPCFNTSHVVIYHSCQVCNPHERNVSIHLMLLFICFILRNCIKIDTFQYISCCYLSENNWTNLYITGVSIHLMLLFIKTPCCNPLRTVTVSIHLMLLFIEYTKGATT